MRHFTKKLKAVSLAIMTISMSAQSLAEDIAITGAKIYTMGEAGVIESGTVLISDGEIKQVLDSQRVPNGYREIDATGKVVTPGFIGALTNLGLVEVGMSAGTVDARAGAHPVSTVGAAYDVQYAINKDSTIIPITRIEGFTSAITGMSGTGQLFNGQGAIIGLEPGFNSTLKAKAYAHADLNNNGADRSGGSRASLWVALNQSLEEAGFAANYEFSPTKAWEGWITSADAKALAPVISGEIPLLVTANRAADILQALALKEKFANLNLVLVDATEGWRVAEQIAAANVPVILNPEDNMPSGFDHLGATLENAGKLHAAGVKVAIGMNTHNIRLAAQHAGNAVANGLPYEAGLASLTSNVASIFNVDNMLGSLTPGMRADLVIWSGDPLEVTEAAEVVIINGEEIEMTSRQIQLRDRYLNQDKSKPVSYR
ncbi:amidohydrolase family protein [Glaciecola sp. 1036]|uniref:amidohydrolase family protein n=1 Tax=Alteromonadaceae TaxID=72275 RepID=UPI003D039A19